jgi:hypothetical protein
MGLLEDRRRAIAEGLLGTTLPAGPQMEPEVGFLEGWAENAGDRLGFLGSVLDPMTWYRALGSLPPPDSPEARKLFRRQGEGLLDVAMDWGVNPLAGGALGIFKGMGANLSDDELRMLQKAYELEQSGASREAIRQATNPPGGSGGWFRAPWDQKWRMEIDDSVALVNPSGVAGARVSNDIPYAMDIDYGPGGLLEHPQLAAAYDQAGLVPHTRVKPSGTALGSDRGSFNPTTGELTYFAPQSAATARSTGLHEVQHAIQGAEGFARGGNAEMMTGIDPAPILARAERLDSLAQSTLPDIAVNAKAKNDLQTLLRLKNDPLYDDYMELVRENNGKPLSAGEVKEKADALWRMGEMASPYNQYRRLAGEAEARLVQARRDLAPQQRGLLDPIEQMDTMLKQEGILGGLDDLIVRYGDGPAMSAPKMTRKLADEMAGKDPRLDEIRAAMRDLDAREQALWDRYAAPGPGRQGLLSGARWDAVEAQERARQAVMGSEEYADILGSRNALSKRMAKERKKLAEQLYRGGLLGFAQ